MKVHKPYDTRNHRELERRMHDYQTVYSTPEGKSVLDDILYYAATHRTAFCLGSNDQTNVNLGKQLIGYHIKNILDSDLQQLQKGGRDE